MIAGSDCRSRLGGRSATIRRVGVPYHESVARHVRSLGSRWAEAERDADLQALEALLAPGFVFVSADGRVVPRDRYLYRHLDSELKHRFVDWEHVTVSVHPGACIAVGTLRRASTDGVTDRAREYRASQVYVQGNGHEWLLAALIVVPLA